MRHIRPTLIDWRLYIPFTKAGTTSPRIFALLQRTCPQQSGARSSRKKQLAGRPELTAHKSEEKPMGSMRFVRATIRPTQLETVVDALARVGQQNPSVTEIKVYGQQGSPQIFRGTLFPAKFLPMLKVEVAVSSEQIDKVIRAISDAARTGQAGDGEILVFDLERAQRICIEEVTADAPKQAA
jgi:nitrogen regulatory protein P-II 2